VPAAFHFVLKGKSMMSINRVLHKQGPDFWASIEREIPKDRPAALTFNSHITGLAVARSLGKYQVPVIALDRDGRAVGLYSKYVTLAALCPNPLEQEEAFIELLLEIGKRLPQKGVLFPSNDEWVFAVSRHRERLQTYFHFPFSHLEIIESILNKEKLYKKAEELGIPIPKTWFPEEWPSFGALAKAVAYPVFVKPVEQRSFYEVFKVKGFRAENDTELERVLAKVAGHPVVVQEIVGQKLSDFYSLCTYIDRRGNVTGAFVGRKIEQYPVSFGTGCLVKSEIQPAILKRGCALLKELSYHGISEAEFIYDERDREYKLLDINTRTWKWIGLPIHCGVNLPALAYFDAIGREFPAAGTQRENVKWVYSRDYQKLKQEGHPFGEIRLSEQEQRWLLEKNVPTDELVDAVIDADDLAPLERLELNDRTSDYVCPC
jgi:D-aspartate ligase